MSLIVEGKNLFAMCVAEEGGIDIHEQEISKSKDIQDLLKSGLAEVNFCVMSPGVKLRLKMNGKEVGLMKRIIDSTYKGVWVAEAIKEVSLARLRELRVRYGIIRMEKRDGKVYLKF